MGGGHDYKLENVDIMGGVKGTELEQRFVFKSLC